MELAFLFIGLCGCFAGLCVGWLCGSRAERRQHRRVCDCAICTQWRAKMAKLGEKLSVELKVVKNAQAR